MPKLKFSHILFGAAALLTVGSIFYLQYDGAPAQPVALASQITPETKSSNTASEAPVTSEQKTEEIYMFANPSDASSNPPLEGWEEEIIKIAKGSGDDLTKVEILLNRIPHLHEAGKLLAMEHAVALIPDNQYMRYRGRLFSLAQNDQMRDAMMTDVLTRDDTLRFQTLVEVLRQPPSKAQEEAKEILEAYLDTNPGNDPGAWQRAVEKMLADNAE